jgi:hypothetical protein
VRKYLDNLLIYGGAILGFITFFKNDFPDFWNQLSNMSGRAMLLTISTIAVLIGLVLKWREKKVTPRNVQQKIRQWLDAFNLEHGIFNYPQWYFTFVVTFHGQRIFVGRPRLLYGRYITIELRTTGVLEEHRAAFDALSQSERAQFYGQLAVETARARISFNANQELSDISIYKQLPITDDLTESKFIDGLTQIYQSGVIIWNTIALRLSEIPVLRQVSLTPGAEGPSGPTGPTQPLPTHGTAAPPP